jgi:hypothetical protein
MPIVEYRFNFADHYGYYSNFSPFSYYYLKQYKPVRTFATLEMRSYCFPSTHMSPILRQIQFGSYLQLKEDT